MQGLESDCHARGPSLHLPGRVASGKVFHLSNAHFVLYGMVVIVIRGHERLTQCF